MKILVQWAKSTPEDWYELDSSQWSKLPQRPVPSTLLSTVDTTEGWIHGLNIQGLVFNGFDHYAVQEITDGIRVTSWNDDDDDWLNDHWALVWDLLEPAHDVKINNVNTRQAITIYAEKQERLDIYADVVECVGRLPWKDFKAPPTNVIRHGVWVEETLNDNLIAAQTRHGWTEWINE